jgi:esterase
MEDHSYELMSNDIIEIFNYLNIKNTNILGHSMGGKLAMLLALTQSHFINKLIIVDIAPCDYPEIDEGIINNLIDLDLDLVKNRSDADKLLSITIFEKCLRLFLLQNLQLTNQSYKWSVNLGIIKKSLSNLKSFPLPTNYKKNNNNTLCIHGAKSNYVDEENLDIFRKYFTNISFKKIENAGHWLHVEKPELFYATISGFLNN